MSLPRYPEYKDSGVAWMGAVPAHWNVGQSRRLFALRNERACESDKQLTASQEHGVIYQDEFVRLEGRRVVQVIKGADILKHVEPNDFVISMRSFQGGIEWCGYRGCISSAYVMLIPCDRVCARFFAYLFKSQPYIQALQTTTNLVRDGQALRYDNFAQVALPLIPHNEQAHIAEFLDRETAKIDALVAEQQRLIELLKEKRQAVISHALTKGLNPNAPVKDSGIEWLGEVPAHWLVSKCGFYLRVLSGFAFPSSGFTDDESAPKLLRGVNVGVSRLRWDDIVRWHREKDDGLDIYEMREGDLVIGMDRPLIAEGIRVARVTSEDLPCLLLQRVVSLTMGPNLGVEYMFRLLSSEMFVAHFSPETTGVSVPHISPEQIRSFVIPVPPLAEQEAISGFLSAETNRIEKLVDAARSAIDLLQERRTALISAAVTGQIDVRPQAQKA